MGDSVVEDDLDRLLDEVETKYCGMGPPGASCRTGGGNKAEAGRCRKILKASSEDESIDELIEDILNVPCSEDNQKQQMELASNHYSKRSFQTSSKKCSPVYIGGGNIPFGVGTNISEKACNQLRCTACDFIIVVFEDNKWDQSCDYLFFRNSMPELSKLKCKMIKKKGTRAYACQCTWRSVQELMDIRTDQQLRWVCGKHSE